MEQLESNADDGGAVGIPTSSPSSTWISMNPKTSKHGQDASQKVRSQAAKASAKARLQTISQRGGRGDPQKGQMVWTLPLRQASSRHLDRRSEGFIKDRPSSFGILRKTKQVDDQVPGIPPQIQPPAFAALPNVINACPIPNDFPHLINHFLQHFAPDPYQKGFLRGREAMRLELWPSMLQSAPLLASMILVAGSHYNLCVAADEAGQSVEPLSLRGFAISSIKSDLLMSSGGCLHPYVIGAIALLAGWELEFGDSKIYDLHMRFLQGVVHPLRIEQVSDSSLSNQYAFPRVIHQLLVNVGFELAVYASRQPYFSLPSPGSRLSLDQSRSTTTWPPGFINAGFLVPRLLELLTQLGDHFDVSIQSLSHLASIFEELEAWDPYKATGSAYSFFQTQEEDDINAQAHYSLRTAGLGLCWLIRRALQTEAGVQFAALDWTSSSGVLDFDLFMTQSTPWHPNVLAGTVFEELTMWALLVTCIVSRNMDRKLASTEKRYESICQSSASSAVRNGITTQAQIHNLIGKYVLPRCWTDASDRCSAVLDQLCHDLDGHVPLGPLDQVRSTRSHSRTMATRYDRRAPYSPTIVESYSAEDMQTECHCDMARPWG